jgi:hypothetical protein
MKSIGGGSTRSYDSKPAPPEISSNKEILVNPRKSRFSVTGITPITDRREFKKNNTGVPESLTRV